METRVRLTFAARKRFPDIGTSHGTVVGSGTSATNPDQWHRVEWPSGRTTWLRAKDIEPIQNEETDISE